MSFVKRNHADVATVTRCFATQSGNWLLVIKRVHGMRAGERRMSLHEKRPRFLELVR